MILRFDASLLFRNKVAIALCLLFLAFQLAPLWINRADPKPGDPQNKCDKHITDPRHDPRSIPRPDDSIKVIRLTNAGEFVERCELTNALYELNWDRPRPAGSYGPETKPDAKHLPKLAVLYIHGWKHSADNSDADRKKFATLIQMLRDQARGTKRVVGIYIGWNADAEMWDWAENLTFWVKKNNADRIAQSSSVTLIVSSIGAIIRADPNRNDQFVAIGHSFGARMLFSATAQSLVTATEEAHPGYPGGRYRVVQALTDAVILLNPAFEAARYSAINDFARNDESFPDKQPPLIVTVSSTGDWATRKAFPIGQWIGLARTDRELQTLGNYEPFRTHTLSRTAAGGCSTDGGDGMVEFLTIADLCLKRETATGSPGASGNHGLVQRFNPFVVAQTTSDIIKDHNDIWNPTFTSWLAGLITILQRSSTGDRKDAAVDKSN